MHRFYLPPAECQTPSLTLSGREAHHALHVLRLKPGERLTVLDGVGHEYRCQVQRCTRNELLLSTEAKHTAPPPPAQITLLQAIPKGKLFESIVQKATELGASRIIPLLSERVVTQLDPEDAREKAAKWQQVAVEAIKQCGSSWLPRVETPLTPQQFLKRAEPFELPLVASLQPESKHPRQYFHAFQAQHRRLPVSLCIWVGPEGDFTPAEIHAIQSAGALPVTLGPLVLRTETAALYSLSVLSYELHASMGEGALAAGDVNVLP